MTRPTICPPAVLLACFLATGFPGRIDAQETERVGPAAASGHVVPTGQLVRPAGSSIAFGGRPVDLVLASDGTRLYVKDDRGLVVIDTRNWTLLQELPFPRQEETGGSMHGIAVRADGKRVYLTTAHHALYEAELGQDGLLTWKRSMHLPGPKAKSPPYPTGIALSRDGKQAFVCLSRNNSLGIVDLEAGRLLREIPVGVAPFAVVLTRDETTAYVSNWGGRRPEKGERTALSSETPVLVDERGVASSGTVSRLDLTTAKSTAEIPVGLHPAGLVLDRQEKRLYVANANSDTVSVIDTQTLRVIHTIGVRPDPELPFGSGTNALEVSGDGHFLFAANAGNNALAVVALADDRPPEVRGFMPTGWYPGAIRTDGSHLYVANVKGEGSRTRQPGKDGWHVTWHRGSVTRVSLPGPMQLARYTAQVREDARVPQVLRSLTRTRSDKKPVPVPRQLGEPSVFEHVVYVIKENRTYDQVFGDIPEGKGDPNLCIFGEKITPNHHALARQFVLLDNFYCNGVVSADGHAWAIEGHVTGYLEKAFGGFTRSYTWGNDPLSYSATGFLWDNALLHGLSFRNYGEFDDAQTIPEDATFTQIYEDYRKDQRKIQFRQAIGIERLRQFTAPDYPGWNMKITDVQRVDRFLKEFRQAEQKGEWPNLVIVFLPQDHTSGTTPDMPTPQAHVADNDLALGRLVEAISHSRFWPKTCIFVIEDDPQDGFDHVDGHRSICLVISPYTKRRQVVSRFYNQTSVLHTMERILGLPPMNQMDAGSPLMTDCFTATPDLTPFKALPNTVPLDELNPKVQNLSGKDRVWALRSLQLDFSRVDQAEEDALNRILWHALRGADTPYPAHLAGAHGRGLKSLRLQHESAEKPR